MKTPHLVTTMLAAAAMMGGSYGTPNVLEVKAPEHDWQPNTRIESSGRGRRNKTSTRSQRQKRKNRRRAFANGNRRAFR